MRYVSCFYCKKVLSESQVINGECRNCRKERILNKKKQRIQRNKSIVDLTDLDSCREKSFKLLCADIIANNEDLQRLYQRRYSLWQQGKLVK